MQQIAVHRVVHQFAKYEQFVQANVSFPSNCLFMEQGMLNHEYPTNRLSPYNCGKMVQREAPGFRLTCLAAAKLAWMTFESRLFFNDQILSKGYCRQGH